MNSRLAALGTACLLLVVSTAVAGPNWLPYVGTLESVDVAARSISFRGPDGVERQAQLPAEGAFLYRTGAMTRPAFDELLKEKGKMVSVIYAAPGRAQVIQMSVAVDVPEKAVLLDLAAEDHLLFFRGIDGARIGLRPSVNLGVPPDAGGKIAEADWQWFQSRMNRQFEVRTFEMAGLRFIYSVVPIVGPQKQAQAQVPETSATR